MRINKKLKSLSSSFILVLAICITVQNGYGQEYKVGTVAFYNLENLFDTIDSPDTKDTEFTPEGSNNYTSKIYEEKLDRMAKVISEIGGEFVPGGPSVIGVSEIENRSVLEDLIKAGKLKSTKYNIVHYNSPDDRGVDVALLYRPNYFKVMNSRSVPVLIPGKEDFNTRDILVVSGEFDGELMHFLVCHWPSRYGGEKRSAPLRNAAAKVARNIIDSIQEADKNAKIILLGDLNDNPDNESVFKYLSAKGKKSKLKNGDLYNPYYEKYKKGIGSNAYKDVWSLFDQLVVSQSLLEKDKSSYRFYKAKIFKKDYLIQQKGRFEGYPFRTFAGGSYLGGYSDHFPVYVVLVKEK